MRVNHNVKAYLLLCVLSGPGGLPLVAGAYDTLLRISASPHPGVCDYDIWGQSSVFSPLATVGVRMPLATAQPRCACVPIAVAPAGAAVLVERGECTFETKVIGFIHPVPGHHQILQWFAIEPAARSTHICTPAGQPRERQ
ncbi:hypothetical protein T492DRAFT_851303 [Pavlovales sp. CCMP2436]|nr:hypothetical protein T492DRAFT_851303 [Pavlovales sp. CCMP2436]